VARSSLRELAGTGTATRPAARRSVAANLLVSLRPGQWTKNLFVFAGLLFGLRLTEPAAVGAAVAAFVIFCGLAGAVYLINDVADRAVDARHPIKARRPIASGALAPSTAIGTALVLVAVALASAYWLHPRFGVIASAYVLLLGLYSGPLKHIVIIDVLTIAIGFVLRVAAGAAVIDVPMSHWLLVCTVLLALFLALSKRRHELVLLADGAIGHRRILQEYSPYLLDQMIGVVTASTLMAYIFYATSAETAEKFGTSLLSLTIPFPLYGIFRYLYLVHQREGGGSPSEMLLNDRPLLVCVALWGAAVTIIIYRPFGLGL
jgi:4-hydroxybenzoate polyprenyltransferase